MRYPSQGHISIKQWAEEDRPREKLLLKGRSALSNVELLAILLGTGSRSQSALDLAKELMNSAGNNLNELAKYKMADFIKIKGIGQAKAISILAAMELLRRRSSEAIRINPKISSSLDVYDQMKEHLMDLEHEEFWILILNRANLIVRKERVSIGGFSGTVADPKVIFSRALENQGSSLVMVHNHPSGNPKPSTADRSLTRKMVQAGKSLDLPILDHLIFTDLGYYSFADEGLI